MSLKHLKMSSSTSLDKFWSYQDLIYNFRTEICGTGSRSEDVY